MDFCLPAFTLLNLFIFLARTFAAQIPEPVGYGKRQGLSRAFRRGENAWRSGGTSIGGQSSDGNLDRSGPGQNGDCKQYIIVSARGTGESQTHPLGYSGFISGVLEAVTDGANYEVVYPATTDYISGPDQGAADAVNFITSQHASCPEQLYVMIGYSEGAMAITKLMNMPQLPAENVAAVVLYGNPYFTGGQPQNACEAKSGKGLAAFTGNTMPSKFSSITFDCCKAEDFICQSQGSLFPHMNYSGSADEQAAIIFSVEKLLSGKDVEACLDGSEA